MRVFNGTNSQLDLPLSGIQRITIPAKSVSGDIMPSNEFLSLLVGSYDYSEIALIVSGPFEINMCSAVSGSAGFVVQSLEEAIERFTPKEIKEEPVCSNCHENPCTCENKTCSCDMSNKAETENRNCCENYKQDDIATEEGEAKKKTKKKSE